jgi:hypothetical protein
MLDFIGTIIITAVTVVCINAVVSTLPVSRGQRLLAALAVGLWVGLAAASATSGLLAVAQPFPIIGLFVLVPLVAVGALASLSSTWRTAMLALPAPLLIGLNTTRVLGVFFLLLAADGRLSGPFPISAGWGDVATGVLAVPALWLAVRPSPSGRTLLAAWNLFGTLDLVVAIALGVMSAQNSPTQVFDVTAGSTAIQMLPWAFIPSVLVPFYLIVHAILFVQLRQVARSQGHGHLAASVA